MAKSKQLLRRLVCQAPPSHTARRDAAHSEPHADHLIIQPLITRCPTQIQTPTLSHAVFSSSPCRTPSSQSRQATAVSTTFPMKELLLASSSPLAMSTRMSRTRPRPHRRTALSCMHIPAKMLRLYCFNFNPLSYFPDVWGIDIFTNGQLLCDYFASQGTQSRIHVQSLTISYSTIGFLVLAIDYFRGVCTHILPTIWLKEGSGSSPVTSQRSGRHHHGAWIRLRGLESEAPGFCCYCCSEVD